jgi:hypothetical protein
MTEQCRVGIQAVRGQRMTTGAIDGDVILPRSVCTVQDLDSNFNTLRRTFSPSSSSFDIIS